jgi:predicted Ser/Thr protein kinase
MEKPRETKKSQEGRSFLGKNPTRGCVVLVAKKGQVIVMKRIQAQDQFRRDLIKEAQISCSVGSHENVAKTMPGYGLLTKITR